MTDVYIKIPEPRVLDGSSFTATAYFRSSGAASASATNSRYRIDNLSTGKEMSGWAALTPAVSIDIAITSAHNKIQNDQSLSERVQLVVASDRGETNATYDSVTWTIENRYGYLGNT